jgi:ESCRT-I complex subunit TSG101
VSSHKGEHTSKLPLILLHTAYDDGRTQLLLLLSGTIPINYRNATYNIPMDLWVPRLYPREPPIAYVRPTNDMLIRKSNNVDPSGRVGGTYLEVWQRKWEVSSDEAKIYR